MPKNPQRFLGLMTNIDPKDIPPGAMVTQRNIGNFRPGRLDVRKGVKLIGTQWSGVTPADTVDAISCHGFVTPHRRFVVYERDDGSVKAAYDGGVVSNIVTGLSAGYPMSCCRDSYGGILMVNGIERGYRWDGVAATADQIGILEPELISGTGNSLPTLAQTGTASKLTVGTYIAAYRYKDRNGFFSNLSGIRTFEVTAADLDSFDWSDIDQSTESRVTHIELYRSTANAPHELYLIDTITNGTTTYTTDDYTDDDLLAMDVERLLPFREQDNITIHANRFAVPPSCKPFIAQYQDVTFYYGRVNYSVGTISASNASASVTVASGAVRTEMVGWKLRVNGQSTRYTVTAVNEGTQVLTVSPVTTASIAASTTYVLTPPEDQANLLYFSGRGENEAVCETNAQRVQDITDCQDLETGLFQYGPYLFALHEHHVYQIAFQRDPRYDLSITLLGYRGCLNNRCAVNANGVPYLMDERGVYRLDGSGPQDLTSMSLKNLFSDNVSLDPEKVKYYFSSYEPHEQVARFYVKYVGDTGTKPTRAICHSTETGQWWDELYPFELSGACNISVDGKLRLALTGADDAIYLYGEGYTDGSSTVIPWSLKTGMMEIIVPVAEGNRPSPTMIRRDLRLLFEPVAIATTDTDSLATLKVYMNHEATARNNAQKHSADRGVSWVNGQPDINISLSNALFPKGQNPGVRVVPLDLVSNDDTISDKFISFELSGNQDGAAVSIKSIDLVGFA